jgi:SHS2 domain-containing protein
MAERGAKLQILSATNPAVEVKGATLTELKVSRNADGLWTAQCVVDV